jgi:hypothetical protein
MDYDYIPALEPPPGVVFNFVNPDSRVNTRIIISSIALVVVVIFVSIRISIRRKIGCFNSEDCKIFSTHKIAFTYSSKGFFYLRLYVCDRSDLNFKT